MDFTTRCLGNFSPFSLIIILNPSSATVDLVKQTPAYPAQDGDSRMMTFVIDQNSVVFEKDLGKETVQATAAISEFNKNWKARGVMAILEGKVVVWKKSGKASVRIADHLTYGNQRRGMGVSSELKVRSSRPSPAFAQDAVTITGETP